MECIQNVCKKDDEQRLSQPHLAADASGDRLNAAEIDGARSSVELHRETVAKDVESGEETRSYESTPKTDAFGGTVNGVYIGRARNILELSFMSNSSDPPLECAAFSNDPRLVQLFLSLDQYSDMEIGYNFRSIIREILPSYVRQKALSDPMKYRMNFRKTAQFIVNWSKFNVNHHDPQLNTYLHRLIKQKYNWSEGLRLQIQITNDVIQLLLEKGADFNIKNSYGETPLILACDFDRCDAIQTMFDWEKKSGMKLDLDARDKIGATALIKAVENHYVSVVRMLLSHKVSVNLHDYYGFTALHAAIEEPSRKWFDLYFFCKGLRKRNFNNEEYPQSDHWKGWLRNILERHELTTQLKEEMINLLLANDETDVSAIDFRGNTPLDLAKKSSKRIASATFKALEDRGIIRNLLEPEDEAPIEVARVDERGGNPLHLLIMSDKFFDSRTCNPQAMGILVDEILPLQENFKHLANATDDKGRTPLHYAAMPYTGGLYCNGMRVLFKLGSNVNAADIYGKTPLHYVKMNDKYELLVQYGADENIKDKKGHTPRDLNQLQILVAISQYNAKKLSDGRKTRYTSLHDNLISAEYLSDLKATELNTDHVTELSRRRVIETIRIYSQTPRPQESSEEAIWKIWTENEPTRLNRRLSQLKPLIQHFIERLADGIKEKDWRFECQPTLVGSANEETQVVLSADFDFNFKLIKFSQLCDPFPHPLAPNGYFQLRWRSSDNTQSLSIAKFACFFNSDQCLLTTEVNSRFQIILEEVLHDPNFWQDEQLFEWEITDKDKRSLSPAGLCKTVRLRLIHPTEDGEGAFLFIDISIDIVACVQLRDWWPEDSLPVGISPAVKANGSTFVFDKPSFDPSKKRGAHFLFSETFARISFAPLESRIIKESSPLIKAAYIICKMIFYPEEKATYQLKTCLLFCIEVLNGSETRNEDEITPKQLAFWVERLMFCFEEFCRHDVYPCYFMPSFKQRGGRITRL